MVIREYQGQQIPAPCKYTLDLAHTTVEFVARHLISKVRGRFTRFSGDIVIGERPEDSSVEVTIDAASVTTGDETRDADLRGPNFFDVEKYPTITFRSTSVQPAGDCWKVTGELTIKDQTRPVVLDVEFEGGGQATPWGEQRIGFSASTEIDQEDWGLNWNQALETGGFMISKKIKIELNVEAVRQ